MRILLIACLVSLSFFGCDRPDIPPPECPVCVECPAPEPQEPELVEVEVAVPFDPTTDIGKCYAWEGGELCFMYTNIMP